ncbi:MAG: hypothetical protein LIO45_03905 [Clostridiales bacterium]|nr:hypothetical protein [Clostridiales bacterium]
MSYAKTFSGRGFPDLEAMTTEELRELLRRDSLLPEDESSDTETVLYAMELLSQRETEPVDVERAWKSFNEQYRPHAEDVGTDSAAQSAAPQSRRRPLRRLLKSAAVLAAAVALLVVGTISAAAVGYNPAERLSLWLESLSGEAWTDDLVTARWSDGAFYFECADVVNPDWVGTKKKLELRGFGAFDDLLPTWMPAGAEEATSMSTMCDLYHYRKICYELPDGAKFSVQMIVFANSQYISQFTADWDGSDVELYDSDGKTVYLIPNGDSMTGICVDDYMETIIKGALTADEIREMFDSIQWSNIYW